MGVVEEGSLHCDIIDSKALGEGINVPFITGSEDIGLVNSADLGGMASQQPSFYYGCCECLCRKHRHILYRSGSAGVGEISNLF